VARGVSDQWSLSFKGGVHEQKKGGFFLMIGYLNVEVDLRCGLGICARMQVSCRRPEHVKEIVESDKASDDCGGPTGLNVFPDPALSGLGQPRCLADPQNREPARSDIVGPQAVWRCVRSPHLGGPDVLSRVHGRRARTRRVLPPSSIRRHAQPPPSPGARIPTNLSALRAPTQAHKSIGTPWNADGLATTYNTCFVDIPGSQSIGCLRFTVRWLFVLSPIDVCRRRPWARPDHLGGGGKDRGDPMNPWIRNIVALVSITCAHGCAIPSVRHSSYTTDTIDISMGLMTGNLFASYTGVHACAFYDIDKISCVDRTASAGASDAF